MQIIITGGAGFLGQRLAKALLGSQLEFEELVLADVVLPSNPFGDKRVTCVQADLVEEDAARKLVTERTTVVFHLAAVVSSHAEKDFDIGSFLGKLSGDWHGSASSRIVCGLCGHRTGRELARKRASAVRFHVSQITCRE